MWQCYVLLVQFQCYRLYLKFPFSITKYGGQIQKSILYRWKYWIIKNPVSKIFSLFAKFYMIMSTKMASKPYMETLVSKISKHWYWKSSYRNSYRNIDIENSKLPNHIKPKSLKFHIDSALKWHYIWTAAWLQLNGSCLYINNGDVMLCKPQRFKPRQCV